jgi:hypothetical protein
MKRFFLILATTSMILLLSACQTGTLEEPTPTTSPAQPGSTVQAATPEVYEPLNACDNFFLPLTTGTIWSYSDGSAMSVGQFEGNDSEGTTILVKLSADGTLEKQYIQCTNGKTEVVKIAALDQDMNETSLKTMDEISNGSCTSRVILPEVENMISAKTWKSCDTLCHVVTDQTINIQLGSFKTRRVECEDGLVRWYAPQFGLIKTCNGKVCAELVSMKAPN